VKEDVQFTEEVGIYLIMLDNEEDIDGSNED